MIGWSSSPLYRFQCSTCGAGYPAEPFLYLCPSCVNNQPATCPPWGVLEVVYEYDRLRETLRWEDIAHPRPGGPPSFAELLPLANLESLPPLAVGDTALYSGGRLGERLGMRALYLKDESRNPTGSYKDRASLLVVAKAREAGVRTVCAASTGNAATALAGMCAAVGMECVVLVPQTAPPAKLTQMLIYGARVFPVRGNYDQAFDLSTRACERLGWYNRNTAYNPFTIDGKRTAAFELCAQLGRRPPDSLWVPVGDGVILAGLWKGFKDLRRLGWIDRLPRLIAVQADGSDAIVEALENDRPEPLPVAGAHSIADSIVVEAPRNGLMALRDVRESGGRGVRVTDAEILEGMALLGRHTGLFAEPSSSAAVAALVKEREAGRVGEDECAVVLLTGTGLKDPAAAGRAVALPAAIEPDLDALLGALD